MALGSGWDPPAKELGWNDFTWWKVRPNRAMVLYVLSDQPVWYSGHFYRGRMQPCLGEDCKCCADGINAQLRYVIACAEPISGRAGLLEIGRSVALQLRDWAETRGKMRGLCFEITKYSGSKNSRMEINHIPNPVGFQYAHIPTPDITTALVATWQKAGMEIPDQLKDYARGSFPRRAAEGQNSPKGAQDAQERASGAEIAPPSGVPEFRPPKRVR